MKKIISLLLALVMLVAVFAGCGAKNEGGETTTEGVVLPASALEILENVWALYGEEETFAIVGGDGEAVVMDAPAAATAENLPYTVHVGLDQLGDIESAASMMHALNSNSFTCGAIQLKDGVDAAAFANTAKDAVLSTQWMCGFPEKLVIASIGEEYVVIAFGVNDIMSVFEKHFGTAYEGATVLVNEAIA